MISAGQSVAREPLKNLRQLQPDARAFRHGRRDPPRATRCALDITFETDALTTLVQEFHAASATRSRRDSPALGRDLWVLSHPDHVRHVLVDHHAQFTKGIGIERVAILLGNGLMTSEGEHWRAQRKMMQPAFHRTVVATLDAAHRTRRPNASRNAGITRPRAASPSNVTQDMSEATLEIVLRALFGDDLDAPRSRAPRQSLRAADRRDRAQPDVRLQVPPARQASCTGRSSPRRRREGVRHDDIVSLLIDARDRQTGEPMSDRELLDEIMHARSSPATRRRRARSTGPGICCRNRPASRRGSMPKSTPPRGAARRIRRARAIPLHAPGDRRGAAALSARVAPDAALDRGRPTPADSTSPAGTTSSSRPTSCTAIRHSGPTRRPSIPTASCRKRPSSAIALRLSAVRPRATRVHRRASGARRNARARRHAGAPLLRLSLVPGQTVEIERAGQPAHPAARHMHVHMRALSIPPTISHGRFATLHRRSRRALRRNARGVHYIAGEDSERRVAYAELHARALGILGTLPARRRARRRATDPAARRPRALRRRVLGVHARDASSRCRSRRATPTSTRPSSSACSRACPPPRLVTERKVFDAPAHVRRATTGSRTSMSRLERRTRLPSTKSRTSRPGASRIAAAPDDIAFIQFSSGSTSEPKGVVLTHRNLMTNIDAILAGIEARATDDASLSWMPLTHDMGLIGFHLMPLVRGRRTG